MNSISQTAWMTRVRRVFISSILVLGVSAWAPSVLMAQSAGTFTATANMTAARTQHTATLLYNGKVLIAGGSDSTSPLASAELYDPATGTFIPTGNMTETHVAHSATLLPDGKVLIAGGQTGNRDAWFPSYITEIYDPSTGTFTATGNMAYSITSVGSLGTLLGNGKVLVMGKDPAQLYDPAAGTFSIAGPYTTIPGAAAVIDTATLLQDGRVFVTGYDFNGGDLISAQIIALYDPVTNSFSPAGIVSGTMGSWGNSTATLLPNGKVLMVGGGDAELYDPTTGLVAGVGKALERHSGATLLSNGQVLLAGGGVSDGSSTRAQPGAELYDPETGAFRNAGSMTVGRFLHAATLLRDGAVLITGGVGGGRSAEIYHAAIVPIAPKVKIVDRNTGSLTTLAVGDAFSFLVSGAAPRSEVRVSQPRWSALLGYTDASGAFTLNGVVAPEVVGAWSQTWSVGSVAAQPNPLSFTITPK